MQPAFAIHTLTGQRHFHHRQPAIDPSGTHSIDNLFDPAGVVPTPEPASLALLALYLVLLATGLLAMALVKHKRLADGIRQATRTQS